MTEQPRGSGFSTLAIHAGARPQATNGSTDWPNGSEAASAEPAVDPVCAMLEERLATLEGGSAALAVGSGTTATLIALHALLRPGDSFIVSRRLHPRFGDQFDHAFPGFGWQAQWADPDKPESFVEALGDRTRAIVIESIADSGQITDVEAIATVAQRARVPLIVDNTLATPYLVRPVEHGADIIVHSSARLLAGRGDSIGGVIVDGGTFDWTGEDRYPSLSRPQPGRGGIGLADTYGNFAFAVACRDLGLRGLGPGLSAGDAALVLGGVETLALRMQRHCDSALAVAQHLSRHHAVGWVRYPGLDGDAGQALARHAYPRGSGAAVTFSLAGGPDAVTDLVRRLALFSPHGEIGDTRSRIACPSPSRGDADPALVRISIGLEDAADIIADLDQALVG